MMPFEMALQTGIAPCGTCIKVLDANTISLYPVYVDAKKEEKIMPLLKFRTAEQTSHAFWAMRDGMRKRKDFAAHLTRAHREMGYGQYL